MFETIPDAVIITLLLLLLLLLLCLLAFYFRTPQSLRFLALSSPSSFVPHPLFTYICNPPGGVEWGRKCPWHQCGFKKHIHSKQGSFFIVIGRIGTASSMVLVLQ
ncbi:hypothetical protein LZ30DRAFT_362267 [Colletotrichum cereale]|nr:hypothetical protein LZ30DRAFT_362267 [Colletotrichum cereale]